MIALAVDDEKLMLNTLTDAIRESEDISVVYDFTSCQKALDFAKDNYFDIAFLDISMRGMGGLALAKNLLNINRISKSFSVPATATMRLMPFPCMYQAIC